MYICIMRKTKEQKNEMLEFISNNLHLSNSVLAEKFNMTHWGIERIMMRNNIKRTTAQISKLRIENGKKSAKIIHEKYKFDGENNPNWKDGISNNNYHYKKIQCERYPEKIRARKKVYYAVKTGKLIRGICETEGCDSINTFAHHEDYNEPLTVNWLCRKHHREKHNNKH